MKIRNGLPIFPVPVFFPAGLKKCAGVPACVSAAGKLFPEKKESLYGIALTGIVLILACFVFCLFAGTDRGGAEKQSFEGKRNESACNYMTLYTVRKMNGFF